MEQPGRISSKHYLTCSAQLFLPAAANGWERLSLKSFIMCTAVH